MFKHYFGNETFVESLKGEPTSFAAVPLDGEGNAIHGLAPEYVSSDKRVVFVRKDGSGVAGNASVATVTVRLGGFAL